MPIEHVSNHAEVHWSPFVPPEEKKSSMVTKIAIAALSAFVATLVTSTICVAIFNPVALASTAIIVSACFVSLAAGILLGYAFKSLKNHLEVDDLPFFIHHPEEDIEPDEKFELEATAGTPQEINAISKGLTNPGCSCFMNALLQNAFSLDVMATFITESLRLISENEELALSNPLLKTPYAKIEQPKGMSFQEYNKLRERLLAEKETTIEKTRPKFITLTPQTVQEVINKHFGDSFEIANFYKALTLKDAASYALTVINKWRAKENISIQEAKLLRVALIKLMNREAIIELKEKTIQQTTTKKSTAKPLYAYILERQKMADAQKNLKAKKPKYGVFKIKHHEKHKAALHKAVAKKLSAEMKPKPKTEISSRWIIPGIDTDMKISSSIQECPNEFFSLLISSLQELTKSTAPTTIRIERKDTAFRLSDNEAETPAFSETLKILEAEKVGHEDHVIMIKTPLGSHTEIDLASLDDYNYCETKVRAIDDDFFDKSQAALKEQFGVVSSKRTFDFALPQNLIIQSKIFEQGDDDELLKMKHVKFKFTDEEALRITFPASEINPLEKSYELKSFVVHQGSSIHGGHYVNYTRVTRDNGTSFWINQNDSESSPVSWSEVRYILNGKSRIAAPCTFAFTAL
jgi:Ubiquitin carboxyl-terminal hydrolase